jgi:paraquat-inducible protein A
MTEQHKQLVACHECDLLLREIDLKSGHTAACPRCGATLYRKTTESLSRTLAICLAAALFFLIANIYPILGIESRGNGNATNLYGAVSSLWDQEMHFISLLVFVTAIIIPALELSLLIYLLLPLRLGLVPPGLSLIMRFLQNIEPWGMVEVFMLGILVALVKLTDNFSIIPGVALWSFGGVTFLMAAVATTFNPRDVWARLNWHSKQKEQV